MFGETMLGMAPLLLPCGAGLGSWLWALVLGAGIAWLGWSWAHVVKRPLLVAVPPFRAFLERHCPIMCETFYPTPWCFEGRLQSMFRHILLSKPPIMYRSELLRLADGGQLVLDWADNPASQRYPDPSTRPTLLLLPGATSNSEASYVLHLVHRLLQVGYRCVVLNWRGCKGDELLTPRAFSVANTEDLETTIAHLRAQLPRAPLLAVGFSMGGTLLLHHLARTGHAAGLEAAMAISPLWDYGEFLNSLEEPLNMVLTQVPLLYLVRRLVKRQGQGLAALVDVDQLLKARTLREIDARYTAPAFGYRTCEEYVQAASSMSGMLAVRVPLLCLSAADDPLAPLNTVPMELLRQVPHVALLMTPCGGHLAFQEGLLPWRHNFPVRLCIQFAAAVLEQGAELRGLRGDPGPGAGAGV